MSTYLEDRMMRKNGKLPKLSFKKEKKPLKKVSDKKLAEIKSNKRGDEKKEDNYFEYWMKHAVPICENCGMEAHWLKEPQTDPGKKKAYDLMWRACQAHVLPKKKTHGFPSLANNLKNHLVLFPSWGGYLCGCHGFFDSSWYNATTMDVWPKAVDIFKELCPFMPEKEKKNIPEQFLKLL